jgi:hypothetical protein
MFLNKLKTAYRMYDSEGILYLFLMLERKLPLLCSVRYLSYYIRYGKSVAKFDKLILINPQEVNFLTTPRMTKHFHHCYHIIDGNWDLNISNEEIYYLGELEKSYYPRRLIRIENYKMYTSFRERFDKNIPWEKTEFYCYLKSNIGKMSHNFPKTYDSDLKIKNRLNEIDKLYQSMKLKGYKKQEELSSNYPLYRGVENKNLEVKVSIGRSGEIFFDEGRHRFIIAKILGITSIPVRVIARHSLWQDKRRQILRARNSKLLDSDMMKKLSDHPDMNDIIN